MEIKELVQSYQQLSGKEVTFSGWIRNKRVGKNVSFLMVNDGTCFETVQVVFKDMPNQEALEKLHIAAAVEVSGELVLTGKDQQPFEINATNIDILAESKEDYPLQPKKHSYEFLRDIAHLRARTNTFNAVFRIRSLLSFAIHEFFNQNGFVMLHAPLITSSDAEGAGEMFQVTTLDLANVKTNEDGSVDYKQDFFNKKANLTVSGQLVAEAYALAFKKVYTFGPTFRAENSNTTRHAAEFWMVEPEIAFANLDDIIVLAKDMLIHVVKYVLAHGRSELSFLNGLNEDVDIIARLEDLVNAKFNVITYKEAVAIIEQAVKDGHKFENEVYFGVDLATEHEKYLTDQVYKAPVFVTNYPRDIKAFYMKDNDDNTTVAATDLLVPGIGELIGGSQREVRYDVLVNKMQEFDLDKEEYDWYLQLREYGGVDHAGFGLGFERLVMYVTGIENIRDVIPFPRTTRNCEY